MADERIKLMLDMGVSAETAEKVAKALDKVAVAAKGAADSYEVLDRTTGTYTVSAGHLQTAMDAQVRKAVEATQAQKAMALILEETARAQVTVGTAATQSIGGHGRGLLGMSYAFQDFSSVLSGGGGLARAMGAVSNNIDQIAVSAGATIKQAAALSIGFTALTAVLPLVIPLVEAFWKSMFGGGEGPEPVVKALDAVEERLKEIRSEFEKIMKLKPFEEKETAQRIEEYFGEVGAGKVVGGVAGAIGATGRGAQLTDADQQRIERARQEMNLAGGRADLQAIAQAEMDKVRSEIQERINQANVEAAGKLIGKAPTDRGARQTIAALARQVPGAFPRGFAGELAELEPEAVRRQDEEVTAAEDEGKRLKDAMKSRRAVEAVNREAPELMKGPVEQFRRQQAEQLKAGKDTMQEATDEFKDLQRQQQQEARQAAQAARDLEREAMAAAASEKDIRRERATGTAEQLMAQGPEIVGAAFGPQAAARASMAGPADVQAIKAQTIRNLEAGNLPYDAILKAFMEVSQAADRQAQAAQRFTGQMSGMVGRMQSTPWPSGLQR